MIAALAIFTAWTLGLALVAGLGELVDRIIERAHRRAYTVGSKR